MICKQVGVLILIINSVFKTQIKKEKKNKAKKRVAFTRQLGKSDKY